MSGSVPQFVARGRNRTDTEIRRYTSIRGRPLFFEERGMILVQSRASILASNSQRKLAGLWKREFPYLQVEVLERGAVYDGLLPVLQIFFDESPDAASRNLVLQHFSSYGHVLALCFMEDLGRSRSIVKRSCITNACSMQWPTFTSPSCVIPRKERLRMRYRRAEPGRFRITSSLLYPSIQISMMLVLVAIRNSGDLSEIPILVSEIPPLRMRSADT